MTSPMFLRTNPRRKRQPDNTNMNYKDSPSFQDAIDSEDEDAINTILSDDESHMTPASLPHTTYQLFATNLRMLPSARTPGGEYQQTKIVRKTMNMTSYDSSPCLPRQDLLNSSIEEKPADNEDEPKESENENKTELNSVNLVFPTTEGGSLVKIAQTTSPASPLLRARRGGPNALVPRSTILKLAEIQRRTNGTEPESPTTKAVKRRQAVFTPRSVSPEQMYFLDNKLAGVVQKREGEKPEQKLVPPRKFVYVIAHAVKNSNTPIARKLYEALKKINPKVLEEPKRKKKPMQPLIKRFSQVANVIKTSIVNFVLEPDSSFILFWRALTIIITLIDLFYLPFLLSFYYPAYSEDLPTLDYPIFAFFATSFTIKFNTAYYHRGTLINERKKIAKHYLKGGFAIELLTLVVCFPRLILRNYFFINFELIRLLRIVFLTSCITKLEDHMRLSVIWSGLVRLVKLWFSLLVVTNFIACTMHALGSSTSEGRTWLDVYGYRYESVYRKYIMSAYWSVTTTLTIGYGDVTPQNDNEKIFAMFIMMIASAMFGYTLNTINIIVEEIDEYKMDKKKKMRRANNYMKMKGLDPDMQVRIRKYLEHTLEEENSKKSIENDFIGMLHGNLKREVLIEVYGKTLRDCVLFKENNFTKRFLADASHALSEIFLSPEQEIFSEKDSHDQSMYFLTRGKVQLYLKECDKVIKTLNKNSYFGEIAFFTGKPRTASAKSLNFSEVFCLQKDRFMDIIRYNGVDKEVFHFLKDTVNLYSRYDALKIRCFSCDEIGHVILECPQLQLIVNKIGIIQQHIRDQERFRRTYQRKRVNKLKYTLDELIEGCEKFQESIEQIQQNEAMSYASIGNLGGMPMPGMSLAQLQKEESIKSAAMMFRKKRMGTLEEQMLDGAEMVAPVETLQFVQQANFYQAKKLSYYQPKNNFYDSYLITLNIDRVANYELYFPHNNIQKMVAALEEKRVAAILGLNETTERTNTAGNKLLKKGLNVIGVYKNLPMIHSKSPKRSRVLDESSSPSLLFSASNPFSPLGNYPRKTSPPRSPGLFNNPNSFQFVPEERQQSYVSRPTITEFSPGRKRGYTGGAVPQSAYAAEEHSSPSVVNVNQDYSRSMLQISLQNHRASQMISPKLIVTPVSGAGGSLKIASQQEFVLSNRGSQITQMDPYNASVLNSYIGDAAGEDFDAGQEDAGAQKSQYVSTLGKIEGFKFEVKSPSKQTISSNRVSRNPGNLKLQTDSQRYKNERDSQSPVLQIRARSESVHINRREKKRISFKEPETKVNVKKHVSSLVGTFGVDKIMKALAEMEGEEDNNGNNVGEDEMR